MEITPIVIIIPMVIAILVFVGALIKTRKYKAVPEQLIVTEEKADKKRWRGFFYVLIATFWAYLSILISWPGWWLYEYPVEIISQFFGAFIASFLVIRLVDRRVILPRQRKEKAKEEEEVDGD